MPRAARLVNPAWAPTTPYHDALRDSGREALLKRWRASRFVRNMPPGFSITWHGAELTADDVHVDVFRAAHAPSRFPDAFAADVAANGFTVEHGAASFCILVPHTYYYRRRYLCMSVDRMCVLNVVIYTLVIGVLLRLAYMIGY